MRLFAQLLFTLFALNLPAMAVEPDEILADAVLENRAREISAELRCLVCQNQSIDDSDADLAADLRLLVRERLTAGDSDVEVLEYVVARYGEFVLLRPVLGLHTILLWLAAPLFLLVGLFVLVKLTRNNQHEVQASMTKEERKALDALAGYGEGEDDVAPKQD